MIERLSVEVADRCGKGCTFCYNGSNPRGSRAWDPDELLTFVRDCAANGVRAVSFGGGEPLQYAPLFGVLRALDGVLFRSITSNGLPLASEPVFQGLLDARPDKVHLSIHFPRSRREVQRVIEQVQRLQGAGVRSGVNLLVRASEVPAAQAAFQALGEAGIGPDRVVVLPMRGGDTPSAAQVAEVAGGARFQSMSCLLACGRSPRFCSLAADQTVAWCSYTTARRPLGSLSWRGLIQALDGLGLTFCG